ncbi:YdcF family protein [Vagococcus bubulae]|nr:YdcF family protein [Vagococcus bubulae]
MTAFFYIIFVGVPIVCFLYWNYFRPTSLWNGFFFLISSGVLYTLLILLLEKANQSLALIFLVPVILVILFLSVLGLSASIVGLFWNEKVLLKREGRSFSNLVPLIVALGLLGVQALMLLVTFYSRNIFLTTLLGFSTATLFYLIFLFIMYGTTAILYNHFPITKKVDYIIILGAGLIDGERVTPLLASRIDRGVALYVRQKRKYGHEPTIILSGGKGPDEKISEAQAMKHYLDSLPVIIKTVYLEEQSTNTEENIQFSEKLAGVRDGISDFKDKQVVIATNNYHLLRAGKIATRLGIHARGVGSKTKMYYLPTAFIREYVGYLVMTKRKHLLFIGFFFIVSLLQFIMYFVAK